MNKLLITLIAFSLVAFTSCKEDEDMDPKYNITFNFSDPVASTMFSQGDTVFINGMISADIEMHGYEVSIVNTSDNNTEVFNSHEHKDGSMFHIHEMWVNNVSSHSDMALTITVDVDHEGTTEKETILFHCHPM